MALWLLRGYRIDGAHCGHHDRLLPEKALDLNPVRNGPRPQNQTGYLYGLLTKAQLNVDKTYPVR